MKRPAIWPVCHLPSIKIVARLHSSSKPYLVFSTVASSKEAHKIATALVREKLAACVNLIPTIHSVFWWKGKIDRANETLLMIKTDQKRLSRVEKSILKFHSYDLPEMIGWPIDWGHKPYLDWLMGSVTSD